MITIKNLSKSFGDKQVLIDVNLEVHEKEIVALLGPSGAGKTTIINILSKEFLPDEGEVYVAVEMSEMGIAYDSGGIYEHLTCLDNLYLYARIYGLPLSVAHELLERVGLGDSMKKAASTLSRGMMQRLVLARAIITNPRLIILDEPTSALDPGTAKSICRLLEDIRNKGTTIFLTTHNMDEALKLCDRVALLHEGRIIMQGNPEEICREHNAVRTLPDLEAVFLKMTGVEL